MTIHPRTWSAAVGVSLVLAGVLSPARAPADTPTPSEHTAAPADAANEDDDISSDYLDRIALVGFITAGVGYATWAITGSISLAQSASLADDCPDDACPADLEGDLDTARGLAQAATAGFVVGVLGTAWGVIALLVADDEDDSTEPAHQAVASVRPLVGPGYVGLTGQL